MNYLSVLRLTCLAIIVLIAIGLQTHTIISGDITWLMHVGKRYLAGGRYYQDFVEVNPPMAIYLYLIPVILSTFLSISFITSITLYIFGVAALTWLVCCYLLKKIFAPADKTIRYCFEIMLAFALFILPTYAFGQREHFFVMLMLPYFLLAVLRLHKQSINKPTAILIGIIAGIGFSIKPFFLLAWLFIEIHMLAKAKSLKINFRIENFSVMLLFLIYAISIILFTPEYVKQIEALIKPTYYLNFHVSLSLLLINHLFVYCVILLIIYGLTRRKLHYQAFVDLLAISMVSMLVNYITQQTLWFYHILPALFFAVLLLTLITADYIKANNPLKSNSITWPFFSHLGTIFILLALQIYIFFVAFGNIKTSYYLTKALFDNPILPIAKSANKHPIYILTDNIAINYPLIDYANTYSPSAFPCLWLISAAHKLGQADKSPAKQQLATQIANFVRTKEINNIIKHKPLFIFVQHKDNIVLLNRNSLFTYSYKVEQLPTFNFLAYFLQDPHFARFWQNYRYKGQAGAFAVYELK